MGKIPIPNQIILLPTDNKRKPKHLILYLRSDYRDIVWKVFSPMVQDSLNQYRETHNMNVIRKQKGLKLPSGYSPNHMYEHHALLNAGKWDLQNIVFLHSSMCIRGDQKGGNCPESRAAVCWSRPCPSKSRQAEIFPPNPARKRNPGPDSRPVRNYTNPVRSRPAGVDLVPSGGIPVSPAVVYKHMFDYIVPYHALCITWCMLWYFVL